MDYQYTDSDIDRFTARNLEILGVGQDQATAIRAKFSETIKKLPAVEQVILIEGMGTNIAGNAEIVNKLYGGIHNVGGFYSTNPVRIRDNFNSASGVVHNPIVMNGDNLDYLMNITRHEEGHRVDNRLSKSGVFYSDAAQSWQARLDAYKDRMANSLAVSPLENNNPIKWVRDKVDDFIQKNLNGSKEPYSNYRNLYDHISHDLYGNPATHPREAFAEMYTHRTSLYELYDGNEARVDRTLKKLYPELWPVYRDEIMPLMTEEAKSLIQKRDANIKSYIETQAKIAEILEQPFDDVDLADKARVAVLDREFQLDLTEAKRELFVYEHPEYSFIKSRRDLFEMEIQLKEQDIYKTVLFDDVESLIHFNEIKDSGGFSSVKDAVFSFNAEKNAMADFYVSVNALSDRLNTSTEEYLGDKTMYQTFTELRAEGGLDAVQEFIDSQITPSQITRYEKEFLEYRDHRMPTSVFTIKEAKELSSLIGTINRNGGRTEMELAIQDIRTEKELFKNYINAHERFENILDNHVSDRTTSITFDQMVADFDSKYDKGGAGAILDEVTRIKVTANDVMDFVTAKESSLAVIRSSELGEEPSYYRKGGVYKAESLAFKHLPENFYQSLKDEIRSIALEGGGNSLRIETERLSFDTHTKIGNIIGTPLPYPNSAIAGADLSSHGMLGQAADTLSKFGKNSDVITGAALGFAAGGLAWVATSSPVAGAEVFYATAVPYGETQIDLARGDLASAHRSAAIETTAIGGAMAGAAGGAIVGGPIGAVVGGIVGGVGAGVVAEHLKPIEVMSYEDVSARMIGITDDNYMDMSPETQSLHAYKNSPDLFKEQFERLEENGSLPLITMDMWKIEPDMDLLINENNLTQSQSAALTQAFKL